MTCDQQLNLAAPRLDLDAFLARKIGKEIFMG